MFKTVKGLILSRARFGDAHAYITALTEEGIVTFGAYGIMSPKNKNFAACQPYTLSEFVLTSKGESFTLSQASTVLHLVKQGIDFERLALVNYVCTMARETVLTPEDAPAVYSLTCTALSLANAGEIPAEIIKAVFEIRMTAALGFQPDLDECIICSRALDGGFFVPSEGGCICNSCIVPDKTNGVSVSDSMINALKKLLVATDRQAFGIRFSDPALQGVFCTLAERFSAEHLDCALTALNYYKQNLKNF